MLLTLLLAAAVAPPSVLDDTFTISLVAAEPDIVTPIGIAIDRRGRLFVVESHTHFPLADYPGPKHDRIKVFEDRDRDGRFETVSVFADDLHHTMNLAFAPDGKLYVAQRDRVFVLEDRNRDGRAETKTPVVVVKSAGVYPHNGLGGLTFSPDGWLYIGMGENMGLAYELVGTDGRTEAGEGEGGNVFRCRPDGRRLERVATGFWNPFGLAFVGSDVLLAVDNDPDARPPNRLLDVVPGADFGFRFRWGRNGLHPFEAWNGELPGTRPMVGPVGEAASGILPYGAAGVLVTSWGDHRIEVHKLRPSGASLAAQWTVLVKGDDNFRPVGVAASPDGSLYVTDWVDRTYNVHGKGRIWRLTRKGGLPRPSAPAKSTARLRMRKLLAEKKAPALLVALEDKDPFIHGAAVTALTSPGLASAALGAVNHRSARVRLGAYLALRRGKHPKSPELIERALGDADEAVRTAALIWAAEDRPLTKGRERSIDEALTAGPTTPSLIRVYAAAAEILGLPPAAAARAPGEEELLARLGKPAAGAAERKAQEEAVWRLAEAKSPDAATVLKAFALDRSRDPDLRADAVQVLALLGAVNGLDALHKDPSTIVQQAARRALKQTNSETVRPTDEAGWRMAASEGKSDPRAGRRVFFHPGIGCFRCHRVDGVGGQVGPELSTIARGMDLEKLVGSIVAPSREIAPENAARVIETKDGRTLNGLLYKEKDGTLLLKAAGVDPVPLRPDEIKADTRSDVSLMPEGLQETMTIQDFRDLMAFLLARK